MNTQILDYDNNRYVDVRTLLAYIREEMRRQHSEDYIMALENIEKNLIKMLSAII